MFVLQTQVSSSLQQATETLETDKWKFTFLLQSKMYALIL